jgi:hypothetical protein
MRQPTGPPNQPDFRTKDYLFAKCRILVDTTGLMLHAVVHAADIQDRDGGALVMAMLSGLFPFRGKIYAGWGLSGWKIPSRSQAGYQSGQRQDRQTRRRRQRLPGASKTLGCRADARVAEPLSAPRQALGM